jgi:HD-GYP domain-containing protein (c-di-GMP phosphodiesterase class II)
MPYHFPPSENCSRGKESSGISTDISWRARAIGATVQAMVTRRPRRSAFTEVEAISEIQAHRGRLYDSGVVDVCAQLFENREYQFSR